MSKDTAPAPRLFPQLKMKLWLVFLLGITVAARRGSDFIGDFAIVNALTFMGLMLAGMSAVIWLTFFSDHSASARYGTLLIVVGGIFAFFSLVRVEGVSGELIPTFRMRWSKAPDELLENPESDTADHVDLQTTTKDDFPGFLGPKRSGHVSDVALATDWSKNKPKILWKLEVGAGWSAFSAVNGFAVTMEQRGDQEWVTCYEIETGKLRWATPSPGRHETTMGGIGPRSTPTIHAGRVFTVGATGLVRCLDGATGKVIWEDALLKRYKQSAAEEQGYVAWGRSNSPLIVDDLLVVPAGGTPEKRVSLIAYDWKTGDVKWESGNTYISYASPNVATILGDRQILSVNESTVSGHDIRNGRVLWEHEWNGSSAAAATASQPVPISDDQILISKHYNQGSALLKLNKDAEGNYTVKREWHKTNLLKTKFTNVVIIGEYAYALSDGILECAEVQTGKKMWKDRKGRFGQGQILGVGNLIIAMSEKRPCALQLVEATPKKFNHLGSFTVFEESDRAWNNLCLYGNKLLVRNWQYAACVELPVKP